jgi:type II secretory pathway pseudopilin PulG
VVVIIAIIGAIAIPKMSRGAAGANESALVSDLTTMRSALELYAQEHGGSYPATTSFVSQLTGYTDATGIVGAGSVRTAPYIYGPYLKAVPPLPVGSYSSHTEVIYNAGGITSCGTTSGGWLYDGQNVYANDPPGDVDMSGKPYQQY